MKAMSHLDDVNFNRHTNMLLKIRILVFEYSTVQYILFFCMYSVFCTVQHIRITLSLLTTIIDNGIFIGVNN